MDTLTNATDAATGSSLATAMAAAANPQKVEWLERLDQAWYQSGGSVVATARRLNATYTHTLRTLAAPQVGHLPPDDPRVFAHAMALANATDGTSRPGKTPKDEVQVATEKTAMAHLAEKTNHELAHRNLIAVAEAEIARDARLLQHSRTVERSGERTREHTGDRTGQQTPMATKRNGQETR